MACYYKHKHSKRRLKDLMGGDMGGGWSHHHPRGCDLEAPCPRRARRVRYHQPRSRSEPRTGKRCCSGLDKFSAQEEPWVGMDFEPSAAGSRASFSRERAGSEPDLMSWGEALKEKSKDCLDPCLTECVRGPLSYAV